MPKSKTTDKEFINYFDRLPPRERFLVKAKDLFGSLAAFYGFEAIHTSLVEDPKAFSALQKAGMLEDRSPVICKTPGGTDVFLRPSGVLGIFRAYISHKMNDLPHPLKFLFEGDVFYAPSWRNSVPGIRSAAEWGLCMIGEEGPIAEAEIIQVIGKGLEKLGIDPSALSLRVNATACNECRPSFRSPYVAYFRPRAYRLCKNCKRNLKKNPTKILACKEESCRMLAQNSPQVLDYLCEVCKKHLRGVLEFLDETKTPYLLDPKFFKDGSLFSSLVFEFVFASPVAVPPVEAVAETTENPAGAEERAAAEPEPAPPSGTVKELTVLAEGGRMSRAGELMLGRRLDVAGGFVNFAALEEVIAKRGLKAPEGEKPKVFLAQLGDLAKRKSLGLIEALRVGGISVQESLGRDSVKSQLKVAERIGAEVALILGQKEALDSTVIIREISSGIQETIPQDKLVEFLKRKLRK